MSYEVIERAVKDNLEALDGIVVVTNDFTKVQSGTRKFVVIKYDSFTQTRWAQRGIHHIVWVFKLELFCRYLNDAETRDLMRDTRQQIIERFNKYPELNGTDGVFDALVTRGTYVRPDAQDPVVVVGSTRYLQEDIFLSVEEEIEVDLQE